MTETSTAAEAHEAILKAIAKHANLAANAAAVRDVAEAYALLTGKITSVNTTNVKTG